MESVNNITSEGKERGNTDFFDNNEHQENLEEIEQLKINQKKENELESTKLKILLSLEDFGIKREDFELVNKDGTLVVISNSSFFSSIVGLNGIGEKRNSRNIKDRTKYDGFDGKINNFLELGISKNEAQTQLRKYCEENNLDFESMKTGGGCVISEGDFSFVGIKRVVGESGDIIEKNKGTIAHEGQHIKFNNYCREKGIEENGILKLLNEVIAHCMNTKDTNGAIDFEKIYQTMKGNENYFYISGIEDKTEYELLLKKLIDQVKKEMVDKNIDSAMIYLIEQNK